MKAVSTADAVSGNRNDARSVVRDIEHSTICPTCRIARTATAVASSFAPPADVNDPQRRVQSIRTIRSRKAFMMTLTDESDMAAAAMIGDSRSPKIG